MVNGGAEERATVDIRLALADTVLHTRLKRDLWQAQLAKRMGRSESRRLKPQTHRSRSI